MQKTDGFATLISQMELLQISVDKSVMSDSERSSISSTIEGIIENAALVIDRTESGIYVKFNPYEVYQFYRSMKQIIDHCDFEHICTSTSYLKVSKTYKERVQDVCNIDRILQRPTLTLFDREVLKCYLLMKSKERAFIHSEILGRKQEVLQNKLFKKMIENGVEIEEGSSDGRAHSGFILRPKEELSADDLSICLRAVVSVRPVLLPDAKNVREKIKRSLATIVNLRRECASPLAELEGAIDILRAKTLFDAQASCQDETGSPSESISKSDKEMFDFLMSMDFSAAFNKLHVANQLFKESFKPFKTTEKQLDVQLLCDRIGRLEEWIEKLDQFRLDFNASIDVLTFKTCYSKTVGNKNLIKSERQCNGLVLEPLEYQKIDGDTVVWDDWVVRYVKELEHKKERQREKEQLSQKTVTSSTSELVCYAYHDRVQRWFQQERAPLVEDKKYAHIVSEKVKKKIHLFHSFAVTADPIVLQEGISEKVSDSNSIKYVLPCEIETASELYRGFLGYCVDQTTKKIWHRCFTQRSQGELLDDLLNKKFFEFDYPVLEVKEEQFSMPTISSGSPIDDQSFIDTKMSRKNVVVIQDPKNQATLRIIRAS